MAGIGELFNKPTGSDAQVDVALKTRERLILAESVLTILTPIAMGLLPDFSVTILQAYFVQLLGVGMLTFGYVEPRLNHLKELRRYPKSTV